MVPMDAAIGGVGEAGHGYLNTHRLTDYRPAAADPLPKSWALAPGAAQLGRTTVICFSTAAAVPGSGTGGGSGGSSSGAGVTGGGQRRRLQQLVQRGVVDTTGGKTTGR
jgi:uncharacterized membrane protein YgcG